MKNLIAVVESSLCLGLLVIVGVLSGCQTDDTTRSASSVQPLEGAALADRCVPRRLETQDYMIGVTSALPNYKGLPAQIQVHRVRPIYDSGREQPGKPDCARLNGNPERAVIMVQGRRTDAVTAFDPPIKGYSLQRAIANAGFDTYTFDHLGYGLSKLTTNAAMENPCNVSNQWDTPLVEPLPLHAINEQSLLVPNLLREQCAHTDNSYFQDIFSNAAELHDMVLHVLDKSKVASVNLVGWSAGGATIGTYLQDAARARNIGLTVLLAPTFNLRPETVPVLGQPKWPVGLNSLESLMEHFSPEASCPGQIPEGTTETLWASQRRYDPLASRWGSMDPVRGGLTRYPTTIRWGWNPTTAANVKNPALIIQGVLDKARSVSGSTDTYNSLGSTDKVLLRIDCASHPAQWEGSTHPSGWAGPAAVVQDAAVQWLKTGTYRGATTGIYHAKVDDTITTDPK